MNKTGHGASFTEADEPCRYRWFDDYRELPHELAKRWHRFTVPSEWNRKIDYACNHRRVNWLGLKTVRLERLQAEFRKLPGWLERQYHPTETQPRWRGNPDKWR